MKLLLVFFLNVNKFISQSEFAKLKMSLKLTNDKEIPIVAFGTVGVRIFKNLHCKLHSEKY